MNYALEHLRKAKSYMVDFLKRYGATTNTVDESVKRDESSKTVIERWQQESKKASQKVCKLEKELDTQKKCDSLNDDRKNQAERYSDATRGS